MVCALIIHYGLAPVSYILSMFSAADMPLFICRLSYLASYLEMADSCSDLK